VVPLIVSRYNIRVTVRGGLTAMLSLNCIFKQDNTYGFENDELEIKLFDVQIVTEDAAILVTSLSTEELVPSTQWVQPYRIKITDLCARRILKNRSTYKNYLRCTIVDRDSVLDILKVPVIQQKVYMWNSYSHSYRKCEIEAELIELVTGDLTEYSEIEDVTLDKGELPIALSTDVNDFIDVGYEEVHGFEVGDIVRVDRDYLSGDITYVKAIADSVDHAKVVGIVTEVISEDIFNYVSSGYIDSDILGLSPLKKGSFYYLSSTEEGKMTDNPTYTGTDVKVCLGCLTDKGFKVDISEPQPYNKTSGFKITGGTDSEIGIEYIDYPNTGEYDSSGEPDTIINPWFYINPIGQESSETPHFSFYQAIAETFFYTKYVEEWIELLDEEGYFLIYYDKKEEDSSGEEPSSGEDITDNQELKYIQNPTRDELENILSYYCTVAMIYWDATNKEAVYIGNLKHGCQWNNVIRWWANRSFRGIIESGFTFTNMPEKETSYDGSENSHAKFGLEEGIWLMEDIEFEQSSVSYLTGFPILYFDTENYYPRIVTNSGYSVYTIYNGEATLVQFNSEGTELKPVSNEYYFLMHIFETNCINNPVVSVMGWEQYSFLEDCYINCSQEIKDIEEKLPYVGYVYIGSIIFQALDVCFCTAKCRIVNSVTPESLAAALAKAASPFIKNGWMPGMPDYSTWTFDNSGRELNIITTNKAYYYLMGEKLLADSLYVIPIEDTYGMWYIYIDENDTVITSQTAWDNADIDKVMIASIFWNNTLQKALYVGFEMHSYELQGSLRRSTHITEFCRWVSGLEMSIVGKDIHITSGELHDEDITALIKDGGGSPFKQSIEPLRCSKYYLLGDEWFVDDDDKTYPLVTELGQVCINESDGSNGYVLTPVQVGDYVCMWLIGTMDVIEPLKLICGTGKGTTEEECITNNPSSSLYNLYEYTDFFCEEWTRFSPIARIITQVTTQPESEWSSSGEEPSSGALPDFDIISIEDTRDEQLENESNDIYVENIEIEVGSSGTMPVVSNENNVLNLKLERSAGMIDLTIALGSLAAYKAWHGNLDDLPTERTGTKTIYFVNKRREVNANLY